MQLLILGASGKTGQHVVQLALARGHAVTGLVRTPARLPVRHPQLISIVGAIQDPAAVAGALSNANAVISCLGAPSPLGRYPAFTRGIAHLLDALAHQPGTRFIYQSFLGVPDGRKQLRFPFNLLVRMVLPGAIADHALNEQRIRRSGLAWTIVRPPKLTNAPPTHRYRLGEAIFAVNRFPTMSRGDVASCLLDQVESGEYYQRAPAILY